MWLALVTGKHQRLPCRACHTSIDRDWSHCPFCDAEDPVTLWPRLKRPLGVGVTVLLSALALAAML